jgi:hypothetical protein
MPTFIPARGRTLHLSSFRLIDQRVDVGIRYGG